MRNKINLILDFLVFSGMLICFSLFREEYRLFATNLVLALLVYLFIKKSRDTRFQPKYAYAETDESQAQRIFYGK